MKQLHLREARRQPGAWHKPLVTRRAWPQTTAHLQHHKMITTSPAIRLWAEVKNVHERKPAPQTAKDCCVLSRQVA